MKRSEEEGFVRRSGIKAIDEDRLVEQHYWDAISDGVENRSIVAHQGRFEGLPNSITTSIGNGTSLDRSIYPSEQPRVYFAERLLRLRANENVEEFSVERRQGRSSLS